MDVIPIAGSLLQTQEFALNKLILHRKLVSFARLPVHTEVLDGVLGVPIVLLEAVGGWDLVIKVDLFLVENETVAAGDYIACRVDQVASTVHKSPIPVVQLAIRCLQNNLLSLSVQLKLSKNLLNIKCGQFSHTSPRESLSLAFALVAGCSRGIMVGSRWQLLQARAVVFRVEVRATTPKYGVVRPVPVLIVV